MTSRVRAGYFAALVVATSCTDSSAPGASVVAPPAISARALGMRLVRVEWSPPPGVEAYRLERRTNLTGSFVTIAPVIPPGAGSAIVSYLDVDVLPETFYGYRVFAVDALGHESSPSLVAGAITPPRPGIEVSTIATIPVPDAVDPDGYWVTLEGPDSIAAPLGVSDRRRFTPLAPGPYTITLSGVRSSCEVNGGPARALSVTDTGVQTISLTAFEVVCRDPARGRIGVRVVVDGDSTDENGFLLATSGILADTTLPDSQRIFHREDAIPPTGRTILFDRLLPGAYEITLEDVAPHCTVGGATQHALSVAPLSDDSVRFDLACQGGGGGAGRPYAWRNTWSPGSAPPGAKVALDVGLDVSATSGQQVGAVQAELRYDAALLRFDSAKAGGLDAPFTMNLLAAGHVAWLGIRQSNPPTGNVPLARFHFTVLGTAGSAVGTRTTITEVLAGDLETMIDTLVRVIEDALAITVGGGNTPPVALANGPYAGTAGSAIAFSAAGSSDPDGAVASYGWTFGDGATATTANPSHTYAAAGSYIATLTVTDNLGATDVAQATVTVTTPGGATPFTWHGTFGAVNPVDSVVSLTITLDLTTDIPETPGPEALATFVIDSLKWNPAVLRYHAFNWGPGGAGVVQTTFTSQGKLIVSSFTLSSSANSGVLHLATIRFKRIASGSATTSSAVGPLVGTPATGSYNYRSKTNVVEATFTAP